MERLFNFLTILGFMAIILTFSIGTLTAEPKEKLFYENRYPEKAVPLTMESYLSGEFAEKSEKAFSDNIYKRDEILKLYTAFNRNVLRKNEVSNVVFGDGVLLPYYKTNYFNKEAVDLDIYDMAAYMETFNRVIEHNGGKFVFAAIPAQFSLYNDKYPDYVCSYAPKLDYVRENFFNALSERGVDYIDMKSVFSQRADKDELYFKTDHHYNCNGAFVAYQSIMQEINRVSGLDLKILTEDEMEYKTLPNKFLGSMSRKIYDVYPNEDKFTMCYPKEQIPFERYDSGTKVAAELFKPPTPDKYVDYESFMGGDFPETLIDTHRPELPSVLVFGDSYTNALETIIYYSFDKTYSVDCRYYNTMSIADYIREKKPDFVVYVRDDTIYLSKENNGNFFGHN